MIFGSPHRRCKLGLALYWAVRLYIACAAVPVLMLAARGLAACGRPGPARRRR
jgi:hypothetical protein